MTSPPRLWPAAAGGIFLGVLSALPIVNVANCCCAWLFAGGVIAAWLMQQNHPAPVTLLDGAAVGLLAGVIGAFVFVLVSWPVNLALGPLMQAWSERIVEGTPDVPPEVREMVQRFGGGGVGLAVGFVMNLFLGMVFSTAGGIVGALAFRRGTPAAPSSQLPPALPDA